MKVIAVIPARYASTRFPAKLMQDLGGKAVIVQTYLATLATGLFDDVFVVTDSEIIFKELERYGGKVLMSKKVHESGSDRIAEAVRDIAADVVINVQGDEPFVNKENLKRLITVFSADASKQIDLASLMISLTDVDEINNPNNVKVVVDHEKSALYFSRSAIPYNRDGNIGVEYFQHIGIYAFRKEALMAFSSWPMGTLEGVEKLEQLRYLEHGKRIKMVLTEELGVGIDTLQDLEKARTLWDAYDRA